MRTIIKIDEKKCVGCGQCVKTCHQGVLALVDGKAKLLREDYCDGLGRCLPVCPVGAISFEQRETAAARQVVPASARLHPTGGCPGSAARILEKSPTAALPATEAGQWPVQIKLAPVNAPYFNNANLLIAADCTAYAFGDFHNRFIHGHVTLIGCPKLDEGDYSEKLTAILETNNVKSVTIVRMEVPCCGGLENAARRALQNSGKEIPWRVVTISINGEILD